MRSNVQLHMGFDTRRMDSQTIRTLRSLRAVKARRSLKFGGWPAEDNFAARVRISDRFVEDDHYEEEEEEQGLGEEE